MSLVPALFRPRLYNIPVRLKLRVLPGFLDTRIFKPGDSDQFPKVVGMAGLHLPFIGELIAPGTLRDASFERTLHRVASQVIRSIE